MDVYNMLVPITLVMWFCGISCFVGGWLVLGRADAKGGGFVVAMGGIAATLTVFISMAVYAPSNSIISGGPVAAPTGAALFLMCPIIYGLVLTSFGFHAFNGWDGRSQGWLAFYMGLTALFCQYMFWPDIFWQVMNFTWVVALFATAAANLTKWPVAKFLAVWLIFACGLFSLLFASCALVAGWSAWGTI
ncbi:MAG: hypothetical protein NO474_00640 [Methanomassiliicoccales archaeon]|nr:hypothetical protein [Methanomassiliicoccales archaeon]